MVRQLHVPGLQETRSSKPQELCCSNLEHGFDTSLVHFSILLHQAAAESMLEVPFTLQAGPSNARARQQRCGADGVKFLKSARQASDKVEQSKHGRCGT